MTSIGNVSCLFDMKISEIFSDVRVSMDKRCKVWSNNHLDFGCWKCNESFMPRDDSELNVCFTHATVLCDECFESHIEEHKTQEERDEEEKRRKEKEELQKKIEESESLIKDLKERLKRI